MPQYVAASTTVKPAATPAPAASAGTTAAPAATPAPSASAGTTASAAPSATAAASAKPTTTPNIPAEDTLSYLIIPHKIQAGDTVMSICDKYKVDFAANDAAIQRLNPSVSYSYLLPGNIILIPSTTYPSSGPYYKIMAHKLVAGDTVYGLCLTYGLSYREQHHLPAAAEQPRQSRHVLRRPDDLHAALRCRLSLQYPTSKCQIAASVHQANTKNRCVGASLRNASARFFFFRSGRNA